MRSGGLDDHPCYFGVGASLGDRLELGKDIPSGLPALRRVFRQTRLDDVFQFRRRRGIGVRQRRRGVGRDRRHQQHAALAVEDLLAGHHLVNHHAEREDIGARIGLGTFQLLGGHVLQRAEHDAWCAQFTAGRCRSLRDFRQPKIQELRAALGEHDV